MASVWDIEETPLREKLHPDIFVEARDRDPTSEETRQAEFVAGCRKNFKSVRVFAVPNGARRTQWEANKAKQEGLYAGWPDTGVCWESAMAAVTAWIEWKDGDGGVSQEQIGVLNWLHARGFPVAVCRTAYGAYLWLKSQGAPVDLGRNIL